MEVALKEEEQRYRVVLRRAERGKETVAKETRTIEDVLRDKNQELRMVDLKVAEMQRMVPNFFVHARSARSFNKRKLTGANFMRRSQERNRTLDARGSRTPQQVKEDIKGLSKLESARSTDVTQREEPPGPAALMQEYSPVPPDTLGVSDEVFVQPPQPPKRKRKKKKREQAKEEEVVYGEAEEEQLQTLQVPTPTSRVPAPADSPVGRHRVSESKVIQEEKYEESASFSEVPPRYTEAPGEAVITDARPAVGGRKKKKKKG